jgi:hypothetical protein
MREVADKERLVDGHILVGVDGFPDFEFEHTIDKKEGIAMGQVLEDLVDIHFSDFL